jgi:hypothetical protein
MDYLGMAQDNFNLMDACIPGISNTTRHVRPYSLMCWIYWRFREVWKTRKTKPTEQDLKRFREKTESLFLWSHKLSDATRGMPGSDAKVPKPNAKGGVRLDFEAWKRNATNTSYMAAVQYRPSLINGLKLLRRDVRSVFKVTAEGEALAQALHEAMQGNDAFDLVCDMDATQATADIAATAYEAWNVMETSDEEARLFREGLFDPASIPAATDETERDDLARRSAFIQLVLDTLTQAEMPLTGWDLREVLAFKRLPDGASLELDAGARVQAERWLLLQLRQVQRQAMESLLAWVERLLVEERFIEPHELWQRASEDVAASKKAIGRSATVEEAVKRCLPSTCDSLEAYSEWLLNQEEPVSIIAEAYELSDATGIEEQTPSDCLTLLLKLERVLSWMPPESFIARELVRQSTAHRLPLYHWRATVQRFAKRSPAELLEFVLKQLVLSQHFAVATHRHEDGNSKLRIAVEEEGFRPLVDFAWRPKPTPDRLETLLSLMRSCHLLREREEGYVVQRVS